MRRPQSAEMVPESDAFEGAPHPRATHAFYGNRAAEQELLEAFRSDRLAQAWILGGRTGIGKATLAWRFARFLFAYPDPRLPQVQRATDLSVPEDHIAARRMLAMSHGDLVPLRREWNEKAKKHFTEIRVDDIRHALQTFHQASGEGGWRIMILDPAEDLNKSSANALLKLIEEPPSRSLFLIISHRPAQILPTLRSRSRMLHMEPLAEDDVMSALKSIDSVWSEHSESDIAAAVARSGGSVRDALRMLDGKGLEMVTRVGALLDALPEIDWPAIHALGDALSKDKSGEFEAFIAAVFDWIAGVVEANATDSPRRLAPFAEVWDKIAAAARETEALNLDRRPLIFSIFADLAAAVRAARSA